MAGYLAQLHHAATAYGDRLGDTRLLPLAIALALHLLSLLVRSGVWCGILRAAVSVPRGAFEASSARFVAWASCIGSA